MINKGLKGCLLLLGIGAIAGMAEGQSFSNFLVNGKGATNQQVSSFGKGGLELNFPPDFIIGKGAQDFDFSYAVAADPGKTLTSFTQYPVGLIRDGSVSITSTLSNSSFTPVNVNFNQTAGASLRPIMGSTSTSKLGASFYQVDTKIHLQTTSTNGLGHLSIYNVTFKQAKQPVPEPVSLAVFALGVGGVILRRKRGSR